MHPRNKHESNLVDKDCKNNHIYLGGGKPISGYTRSNYRSPRHYYKSKGDRLTADTGCPCCTRTAKDNYIERLKDKRSTKRELRYNLKFIKNQPKLI